MMTMTMRVVEGEWGIYRERERGERELIRGILSKSNHLHVIFILSIWSTMAWQVNIFWDRERETRTHEETELQTLSLVVLF